MQRSERCRWMSGRMSGRVAVVAVIGLAAAMAVGCGQQQMEEQNLALKKQIQEIQGVNADLQAQMDTLKAQNQALAADLDKSRAAAAAKAGQPAGAAGGKAPRAKPEFGEGVETAQIGSETHITLPQAILFDPGKDNLKASSKQVLDKIVAVLNKDYAGDKIRVEGHADSQPIKKTKNTWEDNWDLSSNRAMEVLRYMVSKGIDPKRAYAAGFSFYKPVASNDTTAGRAKNRRVVIVVYP
jgi:chemotaxis protein MotB